MSLNTDDLLQIRFLIREEIRNEVASQLIPIHDKLDKMDGHLQAVEADVKELCGMVK